MEVEILESPDQSCDEFLKRKANATICHTYKWSEMVKDAFGYEVFYLVARDGRAIHGVLPLTQVRSVLFGNRMVSQAHGNYGGAITDCSEALDMLYGRAVDLARERGCESIEFRNIEPLPYKGLHLVTDKVSARLPLASDPEELWKSFRSDTKVRNHVRKGQKAGIITLAGGFDKLDEFYRLYTIRMHQLGSPCYSRKLMKAILEMFPANSRIFVAKLGDVTVGARLVVDFNGWVESCWGVTRVEYNNLSPNHVLYWAVMEHYCRKGAAWFDFGRSTADSPHYRFKKQWDAEPLNLNYQFWVRPGRKVNLVSSNNPKYRRRIEMWKKLPLWVTRLLGPYISRNLP